MRKITIYTACLFLLAAAVISCENDDPSKESIFDTSEVKRDSFDKWLLENYVYPYNIRYAYKLEDVELDFGYNVIPAEIEKAKQMAVILKHLWLEAYEEVAEDGVHFIRTTAPKLFHLIGSAEYNATEGTRRLGVAEGGMKITITEVNELQPYNVVNQEFFNTVHHEFAHILHQTKAYPTEFNTISAADYAPTTWQNRELLDAYKLGFVSKYAGKQTQEDFVEIIARYITYTEAQWQEILDLAEEEGRAILAEKFEIVENYLKASWGVNIHELKTVVQRRAAETQFIDFYNLGF